MNYPTTAEIKKAIRKAKADAYTNAKWQARELKKRFPDSDPKAVRRGDFDLRYGYGYDSDHPQENYGIEWIGSFTSLSARDLRDLVEGSYESGEDSHIRWIEVEVYPKVTWIPLDPYGETGKEHSGKREEVDFQDYHPSAPSEWKGWAPLWSEG